MFHSLHILHPHILHILQELHKISLMDGWQDIMLASGQDWQANAGSSHGACQCRWTSINYQWRLTALQLHECCHCLPPVDCKITLKLLLTMLSSLALHCRNPPWPICFNMQNMPKNMQQNMQNMIKKYTEHDKKICRTICKIWQKIYSSMLNMQPVP